MKIEFYRESDGEIIAVFPEKGRKVLQIYAHNGQHQQADRAYIKLLKKATTKEAEALKEELKSIGYDI